MPNEKCDEANEHRQGPEPGPCAYTRRGLGAAVMYVLDPDRGHRRRALLRETVVRLAANATSPDVVNRTRGLVIEMRSRLPSDQVTDAVLAARVRARIDRLDAAGSAG